MLCSTSVGIHLLRGLAALGLIFGAFHLSAYGTAGLIGAAVAAVGAVILLRGCPMCWLLGLFETIIQSKAKTRLDI